MINPSAAAAAIVGLGTSQYSMDSPVNIGISLSSRYFDYDDSELPGSPRRFPSEYRGWDRESDLHSVPFGMRGKELHHRPYASPLTGSTRNLVKDEPLVPRPTFVRPISATGSGSLSAYSSASSSILISPPTSINHNAPTAAHFSISAHELQKREAKIFPKGSPYHRLREYRSESVTSSGHHHQSRGASFDSSNRRRPVSAHLTDSSSDTFLDWSADTIVRRDATLYM